MNNSKSSSSNSTIIGFVLLFLLYIAYMYISQPSAAEMAKWREQKAIQATKDSIARADSIARFQQIQATRDSVLNDTTLTQVQRDSIFEKRNQLNANKKFGIFSNTANDTGKIVSLRNNKIQLDLHTKGGRITKAKLEGYLAYDHTTKAENDDKKPVQLMNHYRNKFEYHIPMQAVRNGKVNTADLNFEVQQHSDSNLVLRAYTNDRSGYIEQKYTLITDSYVVDYDLTFENIQKSAGAVQLQWNTFLDKVEKNASYERSMSSIHYKESEESPSYCTCTTNAEEKLNAPVQWISHAQQFFNTSLIGVNGTSFASADLKTIMTPDDSTHLKELTSVIQLPEKRKLELQFYIGPNDYRELSGLDVSLERIIPYGWSIFGWISRSVIRPIFNFFATFIPNYGLIILLLTLLIRLAMYPLQRKMLVSSVKMSILRPELNKMRARYKDDQQKQQMEQMKMFSQYGVSPLGGCLPMLLTMPIWIALYRFFPASIDFRQKSFLWAEDLVSYDSIWDFGYVPFINMIYGDHLSLFTLLWAISMFGYLYYNSKQMDMTAAAGNMKMMKYMQYAFPVIFFFALNNWASGLTAYMLFSNLINIAQTFITKNYLIDKDKLKAQMEEIKNNPKKQNSMFNRYQKMLEQQQAVAKKKGKK